MKERRSCLIIAGPTGSGKSTYALEKAEQEDGVILNADSLQLYKGLPLLTAQPTKADKEKVPHLLYEIFESEAPLCSAQQWVEWVHHTLIQSVEPGRRVFIVGGTGFYLQALTQGLSPIPSVSLEVREALDKVPLEDLYRELQKVDPPLAERLEPQDRQRITRGLSVWKATGKRLSDWQTMPRTPFPYSFERVYLLPDRLELHQRLEKRLKAMIIQGVFEEVREFLRVLEEKQLLQAPITRALGFQEIRAFWEERITREEAIQKTLEKTRQYAKRQITWFRHQKF